MNLALLPLTISCYGIGIVVISRFTHDFAPPFQWTLLTASFLASFLMARAWEKAGPQEAPPGGDRRDLLPYLIFLPGLLAVLLSPRTQLSSHGFFHYSHVLQLAQGILPPENPTLPGHPANTYWPFHALLSAAASALPIPIPMICALFHLGLLGGSLALSGRLAGVLIPGLSRRQASIASILLLFCGNTLGLLGVLAKGDPRPGTLLGADPRLRSLFEKFMAFNGFPSGVFLFLFSLYLASRLLRGKGSAWDLFFMALASCGALALHPASGLFMALVLPPALALAWAASGRAVPWPSLALLPLVLLLGGALPPLWMYVKEGAQAMGVPAHFDFFGDRDLHSILWVGLYILPFFLVSLRMAVRLREAVPLFLAATAFLGCLLALLTAFPHGNEYKFIYLAVVAAGAAALRSVLSPPDHPLWRRAAVLFVWLVFTNLLFTGLYPFFHPWFTDRVLSYQGSRIVGVRQEGYFKNDSRYADLYQWVRLNTSPDTLMIVPFMDRNRSYLTVLSDRIPFLQDGQVHNRNLPAFRIRRDLLETLYSPQAPARDLSRALAAIRRTFPDRPMAWLVPRELETLGRLAPGPAAFSGAQAKLYLLPPPAGVLP